MNSECSDLALTLAGSLVSLDSLLFFLESFTYLLVLSLGVSVYKNNEITGLLSFNSINYGQKSNKKHINQSIKSISLSQ